MDLNIKINKNNVFNFFTNNLEKIYNKFFLNFINKIKIINPSFIKKILKL